MPFDDPSTRVEIEFAEEIRILDRMAEFLATPDRWCQGSYVNGQQMCLMGAARTAFGAMREGKLIWPPQRTPVSERINDALNTEAGGSVVDFNDTHTHADVLALIARARKRFE